MEIEDLVTFAKELFNGKLFAVRSIYDSVKHP